jgi:hypothetical protein
MAVLQKGKSNYPFWGASINLITGLDPLGLQTTSEATYATMLPGISNLTNRLRYYGFYCWLLDFYFKTEKKGNSKEQYRFIRITFCFRFFHPFSLTTSWYFPLSPLMYVGRQAQKRYLQVRDKNKI